MGSLVPNDSLGRGYCVQFQRVMRTVLGSLHVVVIKASMDIIFDVAESAHAVASFSYGKIISKVQ